MDNELMERNNIENLIEIMDVAVNSSSHVDAEFKDMDGSLFYYSGCEFPFFNGVFNNINNKKISAVDSLENVTSFFSAKNAPYIWWWMQQEALSDDIKKTLDTHRFQSLGEFLVISLKLDEMNLLPTHNNIKTKIVTTDEEYKIFLNIICETMQLSETIKKDFKDMFSSYGPTGKLNHYLGYIGDKPAATLTSYINEKTIGLYTGTTLPQFQKNGLCTALIQHALKDALKAGCQYATAQLMATAMAKGLTEKMGFKTCGRLLPFLKTP